jgi:hypothetical protein
MWINIPEARCTGRTARRPLQVDQRPQAEQQAARAWTTGTKARGGRRRGWPSEGKGPGHGGACPARGAKQGGRKMMPVPGSANAGADRLGRGHAGPDRSFLARPRPERCRSGFRVQNLSELSFLRSSSTILSNNGSLAGPLQTKDNLPGMVARPTRKKEQREGEGRPGSRARGSRHRRQIRRGTKKEPGGRRPRANTGRRIRRDRRATWKRPAAPEQRRAQATRRPD